MSRLNKACLPAVIIVVLGCLICLSVWVGGTLIFGIPTAADRIGEPAPDLHPFQEVILSAFLFIRHSELDLPVSQPDAIVAIEVYEGETADEVVQKLISIGFLDDGSLLRTYLRYRGLDRGIEVGDYFLHGGMSVREIAQALQSAQPFASTLTIPEGWRREEIAALINTYEFDFSGEAFLEASSQPMPVDPIASSLPPGISLEGYLFPDTYRIDEGSSAQDLVQRMLENFSVRVGPDLLEAFEQQGLTLHEAVTLASIVEREAIVPEERARIAAVFLNRLRLEMKLESDPTVQFALGHQSTGAWWKSGLTTQDLTHDSPYNTYLYPGLPPGPIANPGLAALQSVAFPAETTDLYFRALCDGSGRHAFATSFEEHLQNACP